MIDRLILADDLIMDLALTLNLHHANYVLDEEFSAFRLRINNT